MKNLFEEKQWDRDNVKLYKGMLFVNLSGEHWVVLDDCIHRISILLGYKNLPHTVMMEHSITQSKTIMCLSEVKKIVNTNVRLFTMNFSKQHILTGGTAI